MSAGGLADIAAAARRLVEGGPASAYGITGKTEAAYYNMINSKGGVNGRKINFISYDDAY